MVHVVGAVIVKDGRVLAARRGEQMKLPGTWEFPGGKLEPCESEQSALMREVQEELGVHALVGEHIETTAHEYPFGNVTLSTYYATITSGEPAPTEHAELRWCAADELAELNWAPADIPTARRVIAQLRSARQARS
ncbi:MULTISPECIES: (deoxy)nucleoside triphosphate pyrophosphohydrolase [Microbacterium]|uniref:(deoxy)nucleoside triphosphate pyrophosphohydrolase n=1 Tax=Microbacterium TaxID=33882 RepID=UPI00217DAF97|nr:MULTISPECIES: (deoxy)nucleoside triphosphate pyrophosphohydrolase [Microbacterium]UWF77607.1 (deoxy)nucleoside triphosphate pyrophosphohydrolase [Microbacterium neungamense]WCM55778.1 (deoxy)nucleoside triphosphate pyrophosphohydrolase [Microbacterium sp. EF45047]